MDKDINTLRAEVEEARLNLVEEGRLAGLTPAEIRYIADLSERIGLLEAKIADEQDE